MEGNLVRGDAPSSISVTPNTSTPATPTPPRLTPNPTLLDSPPLTLTPTSSSPPPPLTPAPSLSAAHAPKAMAGAGLGLGPHVPHIPHVPHLPLPAPPKLTSTASPALRTYSRPILPSPASRSKTPTSPAPRSPTSPLLPASLGPTPSSSSLSTAGRAPPPVSSSSSGSVGIAATSATISYSMTNGNDRPVSMATSTPIIPFHTPASPANRQGSQPHPLGTRGLVRANHGPSPVRERLSQQTLLLGKGLKGSGQDQVLLRAQMLILTSAMRPAPSSSTRSSSSSSPPSSHPASAQLQSLSVRPPPLGTQAIPPSLRLKPPAPAPPPISRPRTPVFPPLRPRPQPESPTTTTTTTTPTRHLSVAPPALYSPLRAVPLRPRLHSPNGHRALPLRQSSTPQTLAATSAAQIPPISRQLAGLNSRSLSQTSQSQQSSISGSNPMAPLSHFERLPSAARQLQIIALSSGRQAPSAQSPGVESHDAVGQSQRTLGGGDALPPPLKTSLPKTTSPLPSPPSLLRPPSPLDPEAPRAHALVQQGQKQSRSGQNEEQQLFRPTGPPQQKVEEEGGAGVERDNQREQQKVKVEECESPVIEREAVPPNPKEPRAEAVREEERMEFTEQGQSAERGEETDMDQSESPTSKTQCQYQCQSQEPDAKPKQGPAVIRDSDPEPQKPLLGPVPPAVPAPAPAPAQIPVPAPQQLSAQRLLEPHRDVQPASHDDLCESMSTQSDNQSALSSLSSQSPPTSPPFAAPSEPPPPLVPARPPRPDHLSLSQHDPEKVSQPREVEPEENFGQSEDEAERFGLLEDGPWMPRAWPEGRQVLTHLVEGFVIKEGLRPFPVNRSSLLVQEKVSEPPEVNGTNEREVLPVVDKPGPVEHSTDSDEEEEGGATDEQRTRPSQRDRAVLHCQFCGKRGHAHNFMRSKRFCSTACARGFNVRLTKRLRALSTGSRSERSRPSLNRASSVPGKPLLLRLPRDLWSAGRRDKDDRRGEERREERREDDEDDEDDEEEDGRGDGDVSDGAAMETQFRPAPRARRASEPAVTTSTPTTTFKAGPAHWSVEEVTAYIHTLPGCSEVAEGFRLQEIDGQALLLLTEDHLMTSMNIKLGPALKICAHINALKNQ